MEIVGGSFKRKRRKPADPDWVLFMSDDEKEEQRIKSWEKVSLAEVGLSVRIVNTLEDHGIMTVDDLCQKTPGNLRNIPNLGEVTVQNCQKLLDELRLPHKLRD